MSLLSFILPCIRADWEVDRTLVSVFADVAARYGDAVAAATSVGATMTYRELDLLSNKLAQYAISVRKL